MNTKNYCKKYEGKVNLKDYATLISKVKNNQIDIFDAISNSYEIGFNQGFELNKKLKIKSKINIELKNIKTEYLILELEKRRKNITTTRIFTQENETIDIIAYHKKYSSSFKIKHGESFLIVNPEYLINFQ